MKLSVIIITHNEEQNIARALASVAFADEVIVVDSFSTDKTLEICSKFSAQVIQNEFEGYGQQKNFAQNKATGDWILYVDADEVVSVELADNILSTIKEKEGTKQNVYEMNRLNFYCGKPIYHGGWYPDYVVRLAKKNMAKWTQPNVHEKLLPLTNQKPGRIYGDLKHYTFKNILSQVERNMRYAGLGANDFILKKGRKPYLLEVIVRPVGKFLECYFFKGGYLDGFFGFVIAVNSFYSMFIKYVLAKSSDDINKSPKSQ